MRRRELRNAVRMCGTVVWVLLSGLSAQAAVEELWAYESPEGYVDASPAIADLNGDGRPEIIVGTTYGNVIALNAHAETVWRTDIRDTIHFPPTVADVTGDGKPEVIVGNRRERFVCLDGATGEFLWEWAHSGNVEWGSTAIVAADVDEDHVNELILGDATGVVVALEGNGDEAWRYKGAHGWTLCPAVADLEQDGTQEILFGGTNIPLVCLSNAGKKLWQLDAEGRGSSPVVADLDKDGSLEVIVGVGSSIVAVDHTAMILWRHTMGGNLDGGIAVADADQDGEREIYAADLDGQLVKLSSKGELLWSRAVGGRVRRSPSIGDVDGDGVIEILVAGYSEAIHVFSPEGHPEIQLPLENPSNATATIADLFGDGRPCVVCPATQSGVKLFRWESAKAGATILWPEYRLNTGRTAAVAASEQEKAVRVASADLGRFFVGTNEILIKVENRNAQPLTIALSAAFGTEEPSVSILESEEPVVKHALSYIVPGNKSGELELNYTIEANGRVVARRTQREHIIPFQRELLEVARSIEQLHVLAPLFPDAGPLLERLDAFRFRLPGLEERASVATALDRKELRNLCSEVSALHTASTDLLALLKAVVDVTDGKVPRVLVSAANPWAPFGEMDEILEGRIRESSLRVEAFREEYENAALNIFNFGSRTLAFRVERGELSAGDRKVPGKEIITLREGLAVPTEKKDYSVDAIPLLNEGEVLLLPAWSARQLWCEFNTAQLASGDWTSTLRLRSLDVDPLDVPVSLSLTVWPDELPTEQPITLCHWGFVSRSLLKDQPDAAFVDQVEHGTNVFVSAALPEAKYDAQGNLVGEIDFTEHDKYMRQHAPHGFILFGSYQWHLIGPATHEDETYHKAHVAYIRKWVAHLKELGVDYDGFALYPIDEPGLRKELFGQFMRYAKLAREADPNILIYTDPVKRIKMEELEAMAPYVDIWCPNGGSFLKDENADKLAYMKSLGKPMWTYECAGNAKHQSPLGYYRGLSWLAWHHELTGVGYWSYCTSPFDPWFRPNKKGEYLLVYPGRGVVPSKRWKAIRDGLEDYSMLCVLRDATERGTPAQDTAIAANKLMSEDATAIAKFCGDATDTLPGEGGAPLVRQRADTRWEAIKSIRREMAGLLKQLHSSQTDGQE